MHKWLWKVAERMDYDGRWPRWLWRWLLCVEDRRHGHYLEYDE